MLHVEDFCRDWLFSKGDIANAEQPDFAVAAWESVIVPHTWNADDMRPGAPMEQAYRGPAWYRKRFRCPPVESGERVFLLFEAVANFSEVWVDGHFLGGRDGGFLSFRLDITDALSDAADHIVAVRANNAPRLASVPPDPIDWERYGGIYRPVCLGLAGSAHFQHKSIRIRTPDVSAERATVSIALAVRECAVRSRALRVVHRLLDLRGDVISQVETLIATSRGRSVPVEARFPPVLNPELWSPQTPTMYSVESLLVDGDRCLDRETNPLGFRWFRFDPDSGFSLNGQPLKLCGVNAHQDFIGLGNACPERVARRDIELMKEAGLNFLRTSHYPRDERTLDCCDRLGIMVMEEQPFWHGSIRVSHGQALVDNARRLLRQMVRHHGNHPCIIAWNTVNEIMLTPVRAEAHPDPARRTQRHWLAKEEWPFALRVIEAMNDELHQADPDRPTSVVVGASWQNNDDAGITRLADIVCYNGGAVNDQSLGRPVYDICRQRDLGRIGMMSEGVLNDTNCARADWPEELVAWECYALHWSRFYSRDWFCGGAMWVFADYSAKGSYRTRGMVDAARLPCESFHFFKAMWNPQPTVHICGHWDWPGQEGRVRRVVVFTNCDHAELFVNGHSQGTRTPDMTRWPNLPHPPLEWAVPYESGQLQVVARHASLEVSDRRVSSGPPAAIAIISENAQLSADGRDVAFFTATIVDALGHRCYNSALELAIAVSGPARLAGPSPIAAPGGLARALVRSDGREGLVTIRATAVGLSAASITVPATNGSQP